jgi:hypothetical protein
MIDKASANFQKDLDSVETSEDDGARPAYTLNEVVSMKTMATKMGGEHLPDTLSHMDVWDIMNERLTLMLKENTAHDQEPKEFPVKKSSTKTSIAAGQKEKKAEVKKVQRYFAPSPNYKAAKSKVEYQNTILKHGEGKVKNTHYRTPDYSKVQAKVDTWRK